MQQYSSLGSEERGKGRVWRREGRQAFRLFLRWQQHSGAIDSDAALHAPLMQECDILWWISQTEMDHAESLHGPGILWFAPDVFEWSVCELKCLNQPLSKCSSCCYKTNFNDTSMWKAHWFSGRVHSETGRLRVEGVQGSGMDLGGWVAQWLVCCPQFSLYGWCVKCKNRIGILWNVTFTGTLA